jgi:hypothetical protein
LVVPVTLISMRPASKRATFVGAVVVLVLGFAGCVATQPADPASSTADGTAAQSLDKAALSEPALNMILRTESHQEDQRKLHRAEEELTRRCMTARGFAYAVDKGFPGSGNDSEWHPNLQARRAAGYGLNPAGPPVGEPSVRALTPTRQAAHDRALLGDPTRRVTLSLPSGQRFTVPVAGCIAESRARLFGNAVDAGRVFYLPQDAYVTLYDRIVGDPAMHEATRRWAACMAKRGHRYAAPDAARNSVAAAYRAAGDTNATRELDRRVAFADGECTLAAQRPQVFEELGARYAARLPATQRRELNSMAELQAAALRYAHDLAG